MTVSTTTPQVGAAMGGGAMLVYPDGIYKDFSPGLMTALSPMGLGTNIDAIHRRSPRTWLFSTATNVMYGGLILQHNLVYETDGERVRPFMPYNRNCGPKFATLDAFTLFQQHPSHFFFSVSQLQLVPGVGIVHPGDILLCDAAGRARVQFPLSRAGVDDIDGLCDPFERRRFAYSTKLDMISQPPWILHDARAYLLPTVPWYDGTLSLLQTVDGLSCEMHLAPPPPCKGCGD
ncbi:MAG: hypothetical protein GY716_20605 [bacterium]|nr:hypothetical protein [bacterium]